MPNISVDVEQLEVSYNIGIHVTEQKTALENHLQVFI